MKKLTLLLIIALLLAGCAAPAQPQAAEPTQAPAPAETQAGEPAGEPTAAPTAAAEPAAEVKGGTLTRAITSEPPALDPGGAAGAGQNVILPYLFDTLVYRDVDNSYKPYLAEEWTVSDDGRTVTFQLRQGVTFHDGTPLDAEAVVFTYTRAMGKDSPSPLATSLAGVELIEAADPQTVVFHLKQPSASLLSALSTAYAGIVSPTAVEAAGESFGTAPVGSGPFKLETWQPGESVSLVRNEAYAWAPPVVSNPGPPHLERLVFQIIPDSAMQLTAFQAGEIDVLFVNQPSQIAQLQNDPTAQLEQITLNSLIYLGFNTQAAPFDDARVRRAIAHAVDKAELVRLALGGSGEAAFSPLAPTLPAFDPSLAELEPAYDLAHTATLLEEAGFVKEGETWLGPDGQPWAIELLISTRAPNETLAALLQEQLSRAGIPVEIRALDASAAMETAATGAYQMTLSRYDWNDPDVLSVYLSSARIGRTNRSFYSNPALDGLLAQAGQELDDGKRAELYSQAQQILIEEQPWVPLYTPKDTIVTRAALQDEVFGLMGRLLLNDAWMEQ